MPSELLFTGNGVHLSDQGGGAFLHFPKGFFDIGKAIELEHSAGPTIQFSGGLGATVEKLGKERSFGLDQIEFLFRIVLKLGDPGTN